MIPFSARALIIGAFTVALSSQAGASLASSVASAEEPSPQTKKDLERSMRGEAFAHASYRLYAAQAQRENLPSVARLFERTADMEQGHFKEGAALRGTAGDDAANLRDAISGEKYESQTMYPGFARQAEADGDSPAADRFSEVARDEAEHAQAFGTALKAVESGQGAIPEPPQAKLAEVRPGEARVGTQRTMTNLGEAMHGEALAHADYQLFAERAKDPALADLFRGTAQAELGEHFAEQAELSGFLGTTQDNLTSAITGERYESETMYPTFAKRARAAGDTEAATLFAHNAEDEAGHARAFQDALDRLQR